MKNILDLPKRESKPRGIGITSLIDNGQPLNYFTDVINSHYNLIDFVKFGWGTSLVTDKLESKIYELNKLGIDYFFGGTLFEKSFSQGKVKEFIDFCKSHNAKYVEVSDGTIELSLGERAELISEFSKDFKVLTEVGFKDQERSKVFAPKDWIRTMDADFKAGAFKVITESRESGTSGICRADGEVRFGLIEEIISSGLNIDDMLFEAPNKQLQTYFIKRLGSNVNLGNIAFSDVVALETLRLGLRSDTFFAFQHNNSEVKHEKF